jgi:hypothetical protein
MSSQGFLTFAKIIDLDSGDIDVIIIDELGSRSMKIILV